MVPQPSSYSARLLCPLEGAHSPPRGARLAHTSRAKPASQVIRCDMAMGQASVTEYLRGSFPASTVLLRAD